MNVRIDRLIKVSPVTLTHFLKRRRPLLSRLKYAIIKFREVNDHVSVTARIDTINRGVEKERNRDRDVRERVD